MIISIDAEKTIDKIKYQFMIKKKTTQSEPQWKLWTWGDYGVSL